MERFSLPDLEDLSPDDLKQGRSFYLPTNPELEIHVKLDENGVQAYVLDRKKEFGAEVSSVKTHVLRAVMKTDFEVLALCCEDRINHPSLSDIPHRDLKVIPDMKGRGLGTLLLDVTDKIGGVLEREIGFRLDRQILLTKRGYIPTSIHFLENPQQGKAGRIQKWLLVPSESRKIQSLIKFFSTQNYRPERLPFGIEFTHESVIKNKTYGHKFEESLGLEALKSQDLVRNIVDWSDFLAEVEDPDEALPKINDFITNFQFAITEEVLVDEGSI